MLRYITNLGRRKILERTLEKEGVEEIINEGGLKMLCGKSLKLSGGFSVNKCLFVRIKDTDFKAGVNSPQYLAEFLRDNFNGYPTSIEVYENRKNVDGTVIDAIVYINFKAKGKRGRAFRKATLKGECYIDDLKRYSIFCPKREEEF